MEQRKAMEVLVNFAIDRIISAEKHDVFKNVSSFQGREKMILLLTGGMSALGAAFETTERKKRWRQN